MVDSSENQNAAFTRVFDAQSNLQELLDDPDGGAEPGEAAAALAAIKNAGQELMDALNDLSLADFEEEYEETENDASEDDTMERIFS